MCLRLLYEGRVTCDRLSPLLRLVSPIIWLTGPSVVCLMKVLQALFGTPAMDRTVLSIVLSNFLRCNVLRSTLALLIMLRSIVMTCLLRASICSTIPSGRRTQGDLFPLIRFLRVVVVTVTVCLSARSTPAPSRASLVLKSLAWFLITPRL